jgi:hypothetical protein
MDREEINQPINDPLESSLRQFTPRASGIDRDRLMFLAGREAKDEKREAGVNRKANWLWPVAAFVSTGVAACLAIAFGLQVMQQPKERIVVREVFVPAPQTAAVAQAPAAPDFVPAPPPPVSPIGWSLPAGSLLQMRNVALRFGVDALPTDRAASTSTANVPSPIEPWQQLRDSENKSDSSL